MDKDHVDTRKLFFEAAGEQKLTPRELWHLRLCEECREVRLLFRRFAELEKTKNSIGDFKKPANF